MKSIYSPKQILESTEVMNTIGGTLTQYQFLTYLQKVVTAYKAGDNKSAKADFTVKALGAKDIK